MSAENTLPILILAPLIFGGISLLLRSARGALRFCAAGTLATAALAGITAYNVLRGGPAETANGWLMLDALSAQHLLAMITVFCLSSLYALIYFREEAADGRLTPKMAGRYGGLWFGSLAAMMLVLVSNSLGMMWVGVEASTLMTAFLICIHASPGALEAMWKYLLMCSVGVAVAFTGILLVAAATGPAGLHGMDALLWTTLMEAASRLNPMMLKAGFIFIVIGYGTKAGLAPLHNWLPDAHSHAPAPVSAVFSGFLLNAALYCILRCLPLVEAATGNEGWGRSILVIFGLLSILVAAAFIVMQRDVKRLLAYSSVEHIGIMALGAGIGGAGAAAALFHLINHSICKPIAFFCAGRIGQIYGTHDLPGLTMIIRRAPVWGAGLIISLLALVGVAPFSVFLSEFLVLKAAVDHSLYVVAALFLLGLGVVFIAVLRHIIAMAWKPAEQQAGPVKFSLPEALLIFIPLAIVLLLGMWIPGPLLKILSRAAQVLGGLS